jgi:hypothetical protein
MSRSDTLLLSYVRTSWTAMNLSTPAVSPHSASAFESSVRARSSGLEHALIAANAIKNGHFDRVHLFLT